MSNTMSEAGVSFAVFVASSMFSLSGALRTEAAKETKAKFDERIAISATGCFAGYELFDALSNAYELGFQSVAVFPQGPAEHSLGELPKLQFYNADDTHRGHIKEALHKFKHILIHQAWDDQWHRWIDCAEFVGAKIVTVHAGTRKPSEPQEQFLERRVRFLRPIVDHAQNKGIKIGVENEGGKYEDYVSLLHATPHPAVGATIDAGHCAYFDEVESIGNIDERVKRLNDVICRLVRELGERVCHFHIHNVRRYEAVDFTRIPDPYWKPGSLIDHRSVPGGEIDFPRLFVALKEIGYTGMFELELEEPDKEEKALESAQYLNGLLKEANLDDE